MSTSPPYPGKDPDDLQERSPGEGSVPAGEAVDDEVEAWAERERRRRQAWLEGPTEEEKLAWARRQRRRLTLSEPGMVGPTDDEVEAWAEQERKRRQAWLEGPTEEEKQQRASAPGRQFGGTYEGEGLASDAESLAARTRREAELAAQGAWALAMEWPYWLWARLIAAGRSWEEEEFYRPATRRRISLYDDA